MTRLGKCLSAMPMGPQIGKSLVMACVLGCLEPVVTITAILSQRSIFVAPLEQKDKADAAKRRFSEGYPSDHMAMHNAFHDWEAEEARRNGKQFAWRNFLNHTQLTMAA